MWILVSAVLVASLLGSLHCVGMCGPLAIWAAGVDKMARARTLWLSTGLYHLGRGLTYTLVGIAAGALGQMLDWGGDIVGIQLLAARIVGGLMVAFGLISLTRLSLPTVRRWLESKRSLPSSSDQQAIQIHTRSEQSYAPPKPDRITAVILRIRPWVLGLPVPLRALTVGLLTALLPCGWLYIFALLAAGTGSMLLGGLVMSAFWLGSVPLLVGLVAGTRVLTSRVRKAVPIGTAALMVIAGAYTANGRGFANLGSQLQISSSLVDRLQSGESADTIDAQTIQQGVDQLIHTPLPCCPKCLEKKAEVTRESGAASSDNNHSEQLAPQVGKEGQQ